MTGASVMGWMSDHFGTSATAVFAIKYLNSLGYRVTNNMFQENSWYFRNALSISRQAIQDDGGLHGS